MNSKDQAILEIFYGKKSSNVIGWENFSLKILLLFHKKWPNQIAAFTDAYTHAKSQHHSSIQAWRIAELNTENYFWHAQMNGLNQTVVFMYA